MKKKKSPVGVVLVLALLVAAITSSISMFEVGVAYLGEERHMSRALACALVFALCWIFGTLCSLSFGPLADFKLFDRTIFDFFDNLSSNILMTLGSLLTVVFVGWKLKRTDIYDEFTNGGTLSTNAKVFGVLWILIRYIAPIAVLTVFITGLF